MAWNVGCVGATKGEAQQAITQELAALKPVHSEPEQRVIESMRQAVVAALEQLQVDEGWAVTVEVSGRADANAGSFGSFRVFLVRSASSILKNGPR